MLDEHLQYPENDPKLPNLPHRYGETILSDKAFEALLKLSFIGTDKLPAKLSKIITSTPEKIDRITVMVRDLRDIYTAYYDKKIDGSEVLEKCKEISDYAKSIIITKPFSKKKGWSFIHTKDCRAMALIPFYIANETITHQTSIESFVDAIKDRPPFYKTEDFDKSKDDIEESPLELAKISMDKDSFDLYAAEEAFISESHFTTLSPKILLTLADEFEWARTSIISKIAIPCRSLKDLATILRDPDDTPLASLTIPTQRTVRSEGHSIIFEWDTPGYYPFAKGLQENQQLLNELMEPYKKLLQELGGDLTFETKGFTMVATITCPPCQTVNKINSEIGLPEFVAKALTSKAVDIKGTNFNYTFQIPHKGSGHYNLIINNVLLLGQEYTGYKFNGRDPSKTIYDILKFVSKLDSHQSLYEASINLTDLSLGHFLTVNLNYFSQNINGKLDLGHENDCTFVPEILSSRDIMKEVSDILQQIPCKNFWFTFGRTDLEDLFSSLRTTIDSVMSDYPDKELVLDLTQTTLDNDARADFDATFYDEDGNLVSSFRYSDQLSAFLCSYQSQELLPSVIAAFDEAVGYDPTNESKPLNFFYDPYFLGKIELELEKRGIILNANFIFKASCVIADYTLACGINEVSSKPTFEDRLNAIFLYKQIRNLLQSGKITISEVADNKIVVDIL